jgi:hypothetical protein
MIFFISTCSIYEMNDCNLAWSGKSIASFHEKLNNFGVPVRRNDYTKELSNNENVKCLQIKTSVVGSSAIWCRSPFHVNNKKKCFFSDSQNCAGPFVNKTIPLRRDENVIAFKFYAVHFLNYNFSQMTFQLVMICLVGGISTLFTIVLVFYTFLWKNRRKNIVNYWRDFYTGRNVNQG